MWQWRCNTYSNRQETGMILALLDNALIYKCVYREPISPARGVNNGLLRPFLWGESRCWVAPRNYKEQCTVDERYDKRWVQQCTM